MVTLVNLETLSDLEIEEKFQGFFDNSSLTFEGLDLSDKEKTINEIYEFITEKCGYPKNNPVTWYTFSGRRMNYVFNLTDSNAYSDNLTFLVIPDFYDIGFKLSVGARWFDDIVSNNRILQNSIDFCTSPDFGVDYNTTCLN